MRQGGILIGAVLLALASAQGVRYDAETTSTSMGCHHHRDHSHECERRVFSVHAPASGEYRAQLHFALHHSSVDQRTVRVVVNGVRLQELATAGKGANANGTLSTTLLHLHQGINTVDIATTTSPPLSENGGTAHGLVALEIEGALGLHPRGAQIAHVEVEAENASATTGTLIGPSFVFTQLPSEASGRMAIQLTQPGQYVEFALSSPANALSIRFSIPDSPQGGGFDTPIELYVDGVHTRDVMLTSRYSWYYGAYPFTKSPQDGRPHHFYDEVNLWLPATLAEGAKVRLQVPSPTASPHPHTAAGWAQSSCNVSTADKRDCGYYGINETTCEQRNCCWYPINPNPTSIPYCFYPGSAPSPPSPPPPPPPPGSVPITIDLVDFFNVGPPEVQPPNALSVTSFGADPTGKADSTHAFVAAITEAGGSGAIVWVPPGNFTITEHLLVDNVTIVGAGPWYSMLHGDGLGIFGNAAPAESRNVFIRGLSVIGEVKIRNDDAPANGFGGSFTDSIISNVWVSHQKCGFWLDGPLQNLLITGAVIRDTTADGINFHKGVANSVVEYSWVRNTGDDGLAMWSDQIPDTNNTFRYNTVQVPVLANNIAIYGGSDNSVLSNLVLDTITEGGGLHVGNRFNSVPLAGTTTLFNNAAERTGCMDPNWNFGIGAMWFYALDEAMTGAIKVSYNNLTDSPYEAVHFIGNYPVSNVMIDHVNILRAGTFAFQFQCGGNATVSNVVASSVGYYGQYSCVSDFTLVQGPGNSGWNSTHCGFPPS